VQGEQDLLVDEERVREHDERADVARAHDPAGRVAGDGAARTLCLAHGLPLPRGVRGCLYGLSPPEPKCQTGNGGTLPI
jgi:hypothetical protein